MLKDISNRVKGVSRGILNTIQNNSEKVAIKIEIDYDKYATPPEWLAKYHTTNYYYSYYLLLGEGDFH